jgi:hypothetical protein
MQVFAVTMQDPLYVTKTEDQLREKFTSVIAASHDVFDTYIIDVEPHTICKIYPSYPCFNSSPEIEADYLQKYINMSKILRQVADENGAKYIDTVPWRYHRDIKNLGVSAEGFDALSGNSINVLAYSSSDEQTASKIADVIAEVQTRYVVGIKVTPSTTDPYVEGQELLETLTMLKDRPPAAKCIRSKLRFDAFPFSDDLKSFACQNFVRNWNKPELC